MDLSTISSDAPDRAASSEPGPTRPNPFDEGPLSSRKRRRTSHSGSASLSAESPASDQHMLSSGTIDQGDDTDHADQASAMRIDTDSTEPQTPEQQSSAADLASEPPSSRVTTINLRNNPRSETSSSSPISPTPSNVPPQPDSFQGQLDGAIDDPRATPKHVPLPDADATTPSSTASTTSVEADPDADEPINPILSFPFHDHTEPLQAAVSRLIQYFQTASSGEETVLGPLCRWNESCINYFRRIPAQEILEYFKSQPAFWHALPDLFVNIALKRSLFPKNSVLRTTASLAVNGFANLTGVIAAADLEILSGFRATLVQLDEREPPYAISGPLLSGVNRIARREHLRRHSSQNADIEAQRDLLDERAMLLRALHAAPGGRIGCLLKLAQTEVALMTKFPQMIEHLGPVSQLTALLDLEAARGLRNPAHPHLAELRTYLTIGYQFYQVVADALSWIIEKHITHLTIDSATTLLNALTEILRTSLSGEHRQARDRLELHQQNHPGLPAHNLTEMIACEWRFDIMTSLIKSSQMQLRVMAVTQMGAELVQLWKQHNEDSVPNELLVHVADHILQTKLVDYTLGPNCHPEITGESGNIVGFLAVTKLYTNEQTDLLWNTMTKTQNPRVSDALLRMSESVLNLLDRDRLLYLCEKFQGLPIDLFTPNLRTLCERTLKFLALKYRQEVVQPSALHLKLCTRLLRESSVPSSHSQFAHPELHQIAIARFRDLIILGLEPETRQEILADCAQDLSSSSDTTLGSLWCIATMIRPSATDLREAVEDYNFTELLVHELEHAVEAGKKAGLSTILSGPHHSPRTDFLYGIIVHEPASLTDDLGVRLWNVLVGPQAISHEDRDAAWRILNAIIANTKLENPYLSKCFANLLPNLSPDCFSDGALQFAKTILLPLVDEMTEVLDDEQSLAQRAIGLLWNMMLRVADSDLVDSMISILVHDVYIGSKAILAYPHHRARAVHSRLVNRCLGQLDAAAKVLDALGGANDDMSGAQDDSLTRAQQRIFIRSLALLREFLKAHQSKAQFAAPDLRALMSQAPSTLRGEPTELKYESYDGGNKSDMTALDIGADNTAATLLARLREVTGFNNYRIYHQGRIFAPDEDDISRSLDELRMTTGLLLVKKEAGDAAPSTRAKPGASPLEIEILGHFGQLWDYLDLQEPLASEIFHFLVNLPVDAHILETIDSPVTTYRELFPRGHCHKSIYAVYALKEYLKSVRRRQAATADSDIGEDGEDVLAAALSRCQALVVAAISDSEALDACSASNKTFLCLELISLYLQNIEESLSSRPGATSVATAPVDALMDILTFAVDSPRHGSTGELITRTFASILLSTTISVAFWTSLKQNPGVTNLIDRLILQEPSPIIRMEIVKAINIRSTDFDGADVPSAIFCEFLWPVLNSLIPRAIGQPQTCSEFFVLTQLTLKKLLALQSTALHAKDLVYDCIMALADHETTEQLGRPFVEDRLASGLLRLVRCCFKDENILEDCSFDPGLVHDLFWRHLFPPPRQRSMQPTPRSLLSPQSREILCEILLDVARGHSQHQTDLLRQLGKLVLFDYRPHAEPYQYELPMNFDRDLAVRAECGYAGLRNLSNTCYLNSLLTQLFMNTQFRRFMMEASASGHGRDLLEETQITFAHMQETNQRFVDTSQLVSSIKTYDDTMIDIHNQMDVDEFYNLLFDRWESQMTTADERNAFRSFYGGQLVQQVRSKECDHISERLEPFSAIQCDIKGKTTLLDSLRDYVDGEIMEGENKYKCSTCDRHVDAVKRACLKDIPNDLIFHLKRFDFNLRTLTRSKINDYFSFPNRIDMRPYTVDFLNQESPSREEDIFELVGVLVHSGTAESGHYYSYIRERPSNAERENWLEFNDETVSTWDPALLEISTFGGADANLGTDGNGLSFDKTYSAYMLFYQRSSVLKAARDEMQARGLSPPLQVDIIPALSEVIKNNNTVFLRRHCLFDRSHAVFALQFFEYMTTINNGQCSHEHQAERSAMGMLLGHLDQVVGRVKMSAVFHRYRSTLQTCFRKCHRCAEAFLDYFVVRPESFRQLVQRNPDSHFRLAIGDLLLVALEEIREHDPVYYGPEAPPMDDDLSLQHSGIDGVLVLFRKIFENFHCNLRSWNECFHLVLKFAESGDAETAALLHDDWLKDLMFIIAADVSYPGLPEHYAILVRGLSRRMSNKPPSYDAIIQLINHLMKALQPLVQEDMVEEANERLPIYFEDPSQPLPWTAEEVNVLFAEDRDYGGSFFVRRLIEIDQEPDDTCAIIGRLARGDDHMQKCVTRVLGNMISGKAELHSMVPFLRAALTFVCHCNELVTVEQVLRHVAQACRVLENNEAKSFLDFFQLAIEAVATMPLHEAKPGLMVHLELLPLWGPGLIGCVDKRASIIAQQWIEDFLIRHQERYGQEDAELHDKGMLAARQLGVGCLQYLQEHVVNAERQVVSSTIEPLHKMIMVSDQYFKMVTPSGGIPEEAFRSLKDGVLEGVERLLVEELDEDGSGMSPLSYYNWENSSSDQMESMPDAQLRALSG
ncbi:hypothetical protein ACHAQA_001278 [Verticillium albo-atrum]